MKKLIGFVIFFVFVLAAVFSVYADDMNLKSVETILAEIQQEQGVQSPEDIVADKVSQAKLEELGDSVMEAMIGNTERHEQMDSRLGGEGSASLTAFHIKLGYNYLVGYPNGMMTLMTSGMMGPISDRGNSYNWSGMMGGNYYNGNSGMMGYFGWGGMLMGAIFLIMLIIAIVFAVKAFNSKNTSFSGESPLDILKKRYANGEIEKEEYERIKEHLIK